MALAAGTRLGSYDIVSLLGAGGMGEVYRATDTKLGRDVALKVIASDVATEPDRLERFRREAKTLAALDHPNIVTVFSVEDAPAAPGQPAVHFLTMQLIEGQALDRVIGEAGLPIAELIAIGGAVADALAAAHDRGIVHRDLKPANVMVTADGRIKVLDFGLAKEIVGTGLGEATLTALGNTGPGVVMGTPAYMSPEQVAGRPVDHRTDIFSLGILLYEMACGRRPFAGASSIELASAILKDTPASVSELRAEVPAGVADVIRRCLEKNPRARVQAARDVASELRGHSSPTPPYPRSAIASGDHESFWIAVLPFKARGSDASIESFAEGMTEEIVAGLSRFTYLRVGARGSPAEHARYVMEGAIRQAGATCRVAVQLVDAVTKTTLWAETFDRSYRAEDIFTLQDQLVPRIVSTVADQHGVLVHNMSALIRTKRDDQLTAHEAALSVFGFHERMTPGEHARIRDILERAVHDAPHDSDCWAMLATVYTDEHMFGFNVRPDPLGRAQAAARRAVELSPSSALASQALAQSLFFRKELQACRPVAERTIALNPMDGAISAFMGLLLALCGDWDRGCNAAEAARTLNPHFPGWYWLPPAFRAIHERKYRDAVNCAMRVHIPGYFWVPAITATAYGHLNELDQARRAVDELITIRPDFAATARDEFSKWFQPDLVEHWLEGLRKAGLDRAGSTPPASASIATASAKTTDAGPSIAVLPFANMSADKEEDYFSDGLAEEIINLLAQVPGLKVIARTSAFAFRGKEQDIRGIADALGVRTILQGSVRRAGSRLRITTQLIGATDGTHLWSERYDRDLTDVFAIQDDIARAIADALQVRLTSRARQANIDAYQDYLRGRYWLLKLTPESLARGKQHFEQALRTDPHYANAYAGLAEYYHTLMILGLQPPLAMTPLVTASANEALARDPNNGEAHSLLASVVGSSEYAWDAARHHHDKALSAEPLPPMARFRYAVWYLLPQGQFDEAIAQCRLALETDPLAMALHYAMAECLRHRRQPAESLDWIRRALEIEPDLYLLLMEQAEGQLATGLIPEAIDSLSRVVERAPWWPMGAAMLAAAYRSAGDHDRSEQWSRTLTSLPPRGLANAIRHAAWGDADAMFGALDDAWAERDVLLLVLDGMFVFHRYRSDPRYAALRARMNLAPAARP